MPGSVLRRDRDDGHARVDAREHVDALALARDEHDGLDALQHEPVHGLGQRVGVERAHARLADGVAGLARGLVEAERRARRPVVGPPGLDQPDRPDRGAPWRGRSATARS